MRSATDLKTRIVTWKIRGRKRLRPVATVAIVSKIETLMVHRGAQGSHPVPLMAGLAIDGRSRKSLRWTPCVTLLARNRSVRADQWKVGGSVCVNVEPTVPILLIVATGAAGTELSLMRVRMATFTLLHQSVCKIVQMTVFAPDPLVLSPQWKAGFLVRKLDRCPT